MHHIDPELLEAALAGDIPVKTLMRQLLAHMAELCPECAATVRELRQAVVRGDLDLGPLPETAAWTGAPTDGVNGRHADPRYVGAFDRVQEEAHVWVMRARRERRLARQDVERLLRVPRKDRARQIERARTRYRSRLSPTSCSRRAVA